MLPKSLLDISESERAVLWNKFTHEDSLLSELEYYQDKVKTMGSPVTMLDVAVLTIYRHHIKNIEKLLHASARYPIKA